MKKLGQVVIVATINLICCSIVWVNSDKLPTTMVELSVYNSDDEDFGFASGDGDEYVESGFASGDGDAHLEPTLGPDLGHGSTVNTLTTTTPSTTTTPRNGFVPHSGENGCDCEASNIECRSGECVPANSRCDGTAQCADASDEAGCPPPIVSIRPTPDAQETLLMAQMQDILEFLKSTKSDLEKINERLDRLEKHQDINHAIDSLREAVTAIEDKFTSALDSNSEQIRTLRVELDICQTKRDTEVNEQFLLLNNKLDLLEQNAIACQGNLSFHAIGLPSLKVEGGSIQNNAAFLRNPDPDIFLSRLPQPVIGKSLNGSTFEQIAAALPKRWSMAVQILNYMDVELTGYRLRRFTIWENARAPDTILANTREVATFIQLRFMPQGELIYGIGGTNLFLHLYFHCSRDYRTLAAALLPNMKPVAFIGLNSCTRYIHNGTIESHKCIAQIPLDTAESLTVNEGNIFAKVAFMYSSTTSTITTQIFEM